MAEIQFNQLSVLAANPPLTDYAIIYKAAGRTAPGSDMTAANTAAANNPPEFITLEDLIALIRPADATVATSGLVELATTTEAVTGTATDKAVTPAGVAAAIAAGGGGGGGGGVEETGESIVSKLTTLAEGNRLSYTALDDRPTLVTSFVGLSDTPPSLGTAGQLVAVNTAANAVEFVDAPSGGGVGDNLLSNPTAAFTPSRFSQTWQRAYADLGFRMENGNYYLVVFGNAFNDNAATASTGSPEARLIYMQNGNGDTRHIESNSRGQLVMMLYEFRTAASGNTSLYVSVSSSADLFAFNIQRIQQLG